MNEQAKTFEITCRNCSETFPVPEEALSQKDFPCPGCAFLNHVEKPGTFSRSNILAKIGMIVGNEAEVDEHTAYKSRIKGGLALLLAVILALVYVDYAGQSHTSANAPTGLSTVTNSIGMQLTMIPAGTFIMGSAMGSNDEKPVRRVTISKPFFMGIHEVTVGQWLEVMKEPPMFPMSSDKPILLISWKQAKEFCTRLSAKEQATYRLPTEAEWEFAARSGSTTEFFWGDLYAEGYAWCHINSGRPTRSTHPVGALKPNLWGLYDMSGNVGEWCEDYYGKYSSEDQTDPVGPTEGGFRVVRGGDYTTIPVGLRSASRGKADPDAPGPGFRIVKDL